jgi:hypothetical protein
MLTLTRVYRVAGICPLIILLLLLMSCGGGGGGGAAVVPGPVAPPATAVQKVNAGNSRASFQEMNAAFNNAGRGVVVWTEVTGMSNRVLWAYFDGAVLHPEAELAPYAAQPSVATNGTDFMLVWSSYGQICSSSCSSSGILGSTITVSSWNSIDPDIASNGSGYAAVWRSFDPGSSQYRIFANSYSAASWTTAKLVDTLSNYDYYPPRIASNGAGYAVTWPKDDGSRNGHYDIYATVASGGTVTATWQPPSLLEAASGSAFSPDIASNGTGYAVAWRQIDDIGYYSVYANLYSAGTWSSGGTLLENSVGVFGDAVIAGIASGYAVAWSQYDGISISAYANVYSGGTWTSAALIETSPNSALQVAIASNGAGYAVAWQQDNGVVKDINASRYSAGSWSTPVLLDAGEADAQWPLIVPFPTGYAVAWYQNDATGDPNLYGTVYFGGAWTPVTAPLAQGAWKGTSNWPKMATNGKGVSLAVWPEYHGSQWRLFGAVNGSGVWGAPFLIDDNMNRDVAVATNGTSFMVTWYSNAQGAILAATCSGDGTPGTPEKVAPADFEYAHNPALASDGRGYAVVWSQLNHVGTAAGNIYSNVYSNGTWSKDGGGNPTPWTIENSSTYAYWPSIASNRHGYAAAWIQHDGVNYSVFANIFTSGTWSTGGTLLESAAGSVDSPSIASNGSGYAVVWSQEDATPTIRIYSNIYRNGSWQMSGGVPDATLIDNLPQFAANPVVASNNRGYAVAWQQYDGTATSIFSKIYSSGTWSTGSTRLDDSDEYAYGPSIASSGTGYAVSWIQDDGLFNSVYASMYNAGRWSAGGTLLETDDNDADAAMIVSNGNTYSAIWLQLDPADLMVNDVRAKLGFPQ